MRVFAFVFARGGSKGLKHKNIKPLSGKPLIAWSIETAQAMPGIEQIFVSTDSVEIKKIAENYNAIVIDRPVHLASDDAPEWLAWQHAVSWVEERYGVFDTFVSLPATSPLRSIVDVDACIQEYEKDSSIDAVVTMTESERSPWFNMVKTNVSGFLETVNKNDNQYSRRQDAPKTYDVTTVCYVTGPDYIKKSQNLWAGNVSGITVPRDRAVDIDTIDDFLFAEYLLTKRKNNEPE